MGSYVIIVRTLYDPWYSRQRHLRLRRRLVVDGAADVRRKDSERDGPRGQGGRARLPGQQYREVQGTSAPCRLDILSSSLATMHKGPFINDVYKIFFWNSSPLIYIVLSTQLLLPASPFVRTSFMDGSQVLTKRLRVNAFLLLIAGGLAEGQGPDDIGTSQEGDHAQRQDRRRPRGGQVSRSVVWPLVTNCDWGWVACIGLMNQ